MHAHPMIRISKEDARPLAVVRCTTYASGGAEAPARDGSVQMRLPLGAWIVDLVPERLESRSENGRP